MCVSPASLRGFSETRASFKVYAPYCPSLFSDGALVGCCVAVCEFQFCSHEGRHLVQVCVLVTKSSFIPYSFETTFQTTPIPQSQSPRSFKSSSIIQNSFSQELFRTNLWWFKAFPLTDG